MVAAVGLTVKLPLTGVAIVALVTVSGCDPAAAVLSTVMVAVPVAVPVATGDVGLVVAQVGDAGLTTPLGGGGMVHATLGGLICRMPVAVSVQPDCTFRYVTLTVSGTGCVPVTPPDTQGCVANVKFDGTVTVNEVTFVAVLVDAEVTNPVLSPIVIFVVPGIAFTTWTVMLPPGATAVGETLMIVGFGTLKMNAGPAAESPLSIFVTLIGP